MSGYGLALGGGGAKGGYEIGVWKALLELDIPIDIITGTSVGALNGAVIIQNDFDLAYKIWTGITLDSVIKVEKQIALQEKNNNSFKEIFNTITKAFVSGGLDITPLRQLLKDMLNEEKIRESKIDLGVVTFSLSDFKPVRLFKNDIPEGKFINYLLASACFPSFKPETIANKKFIDGGVSDNIPVSLLIERKVKDIIAVDISGPGLTKKVDTTGVNIINIKNSHPLGGLLDFNPEQSKINIEIGYYDTLKKFGKLKGKKYYVFKTKDYENSKEKYLRTLSIDDFKKMYHFLGLDWSEQPVPLNNLIIYNIMHTITKYSDGKLSADSVLPAMVEITAEQLGLKRKKTYSLNELIDEVLKEYEKICKTKDFNTYKDNLSKALLNKKDKEFDKDFKKILNEVKFLIFYSPNFEKDDEKIKMFRRLVAVTFPKISIANMSIALLLSKQDNSQ